VALFVVIFGKKNFKKKEHVRVQLNVGRRQAAGGQGEIGLVVVGVIFFLLRFDILF